MTKTESEGEEVEAKDRPPNNFMASFCSMRALMQNYAVHFGNESDETPQWFVDSNTRKIRRLSSNHFDKNLNDDNSNNNSGDRKKCHDRRATASNDEEDSELTVADANRDMVPAAVYPWHHGRIEKHEAEIMLRSAHLYPSGSFLVRDDLEVQGEH